MPRVINDAKDLPRLKRIRINWLPLLDGRKYRLVYGKDFSNPIASIRTTALRIANKHSLKVATSADGKDLIIQFYRAEGAE